MKLTTITTAEDQAEIDAIRAKVIGWSDDRQYYFFKALLAARPDIEDLLMLGVYHGRDIAFILAILKRYHPSRALRIVGVDRFSSAPCADWPAWAKSWEHLTNGMPAPDIGSAQANTESPMVRLVKCDDETFMDEANLQGQKYDAIYFDAAHDKESVQRQIRQCQALCNGQTTVLCGDDFSNLNGWGVKTAVEEGFNQFWLFREWVWFSVRAHLKS